MLPTAAMVMQRSLLLASASPRRREILGTLGLEFEVAAVDADERLLEGEEPGAYLERVVSEKLRLAAPLAASRGRGAVLVADTSVVLGGVVLGKPVDAADNRAMLRALSGRSHEVMTRFAIAVVGGAPVVPVVATAGGAGASEGAGGAERAGGPEGRTAVARTVTTSVTFRALTGDEIERYVASGEGRDKAGGYAIQGLGAFAVEGIAGSYSNVVGLPACEVVQALLEAGVIDVFPPGSP
jgi:septum formation protein